MTSPLSAVAIDSAGVVVSVLPLERGCAAEVAYFKARWVALGFRVAPLPFVPRPGVLVSEPVDAEVAG